MFIHDVHILKKVRLKYAYTLIYIHMKLIQIRIHLFLSLKKKAANKKYVTAVPTKTSSFLLTYPWTFGIRFVMLVSTVLTFSGSRLVPISEKTRAWPSSEKSCYGQHSVEFFIVEDCADFTENKIEVKLRKRSGLYS